MPPMARTVKVANLSPKATERDIHDFFSFSGEIEHIKVESVEDDSRIAFVTFKDPHALDTAVLLSGATIVDQIVGITEVADYDSTSGANDMNKAVAGVGTGIGALDKAQDMVSTMLSRGYVLSRDTMNKARTFDEKHQLTANATATVSSLDKRIGFTQTVSTGAAVVNEHVKAIDQKYQVSDKTRSAFLAAEQKMSTAGSALLKNKYVFTGASWVTGAFNRVTKAAGEVGQKTVEKVTGH